MLYIYSLMCFFLPCLLWQFVHREDIRKHRYGKLHLCWSLIFILYCYTAIEDAAGIGTFWDLLAYRELKGNINLILFKNSTNLQNMLNVIMTIPLGFLLPLIWKEYRYGWNVVLTGFFLSALIEFCQLFCYRATDVNDLMMNTLGSLVGYVCWLLLYALYRLVFRKTVDRSVTIRRGEALVYIIEGTLGIFFLYNWRWVL